jgi:hypothetical protein
MQAIQSLVSSLEIGQPQIEGGLAVFPLFRKDAAVMDYLLLDEALDLELAHVTEVSEAGHVPELAFENDSPQRVLLVDGDELLGARQNRIVNISILVGAGKKLVIPVSCVEQGRWSYRSARFAAAKRSLFASAKAKKMASMSRAMRDGGSRRSDQREIWSGISAQMSARRVESDTGAMSDLYEAVEPDLDRYAKAFTVQPGQAGAVFADGSRVIGLELFDAPEAFGKCFGKMVRSYALDVVEAPMPVDAAAVKIEVRRFLDEMLKAATEKYAALGDGEDVRLAGEGIAGGALLDGERVVHLAAYRVEGAE